MTRILKDGHATFIEFAENSSILLKEKTVTPPGVDGGGENDTTTMHNVDWRSRQPKQLKTLTETSATVAYDPAVFPQVVTMCQVNQLITVTFPDGDTWAFWGWLDKFTPGEHQEGEQPTAEIIVIASLEDDNGDLVAPVHTPAA